MKLAYLAPLALCLAATACAQQGPKYNWGAYPSAFLDVQRDPTKQAAFEKSLSDIVNNPDPDKKVPPGIYAEYGYVLQQRGDLGGATMMYNKEKAAWPESATLMNKQLNSLPATSAAKPVS